MAATGSRISIAAIGTSLASFLDLPATTAARENPVVGDQCFKRRIVPFRGLGLQFSRIPIETEPFEIALHLLDIAGFGPLTIEVFQAKQNFAPCRSSIEPT